MNRKNMRVVRSVRNGERGQSLILMAGLLIGLLSMAALVIDLGNVYFSYRQLQAATDAAALAGAEDLPNTTATVTATTYSSANSGDKNFNTVQSVMTNITETATLECLTTTQVPCLPPAGMNAIVVTETAKVKTTFAKLFGVSSVSISATATGSAKNGNFGPFNVMMVVDNTPSMSLVDSGCTLPSPNNTEIGCALAGLRTLVSTLAPCASTLANCGTGFTPVDEVGLEVFPQLSNSAQSASDTDCNSLTSPTFVNYNQSGVYNVLPLGSDYRNSDSSALNTASAMSKAIGGGVSGCAPLSVSTGQNTYFAGAIKDAQAQLTLNSRTNVTNVIVLLSDGDSNVPSGQIPGNEQLNQCAQAIAAAQSAALAGTWVYTVAYGAITSSSTSCKYDNPAHGGSKAISACQTLQQMASDSTKFFSDTSAQGGQGAGCTSAARPITDLNQIFAAIANDFTSARLIKNGTT